MGDFVAFGPDPVGVLERLAQLGDARFIRGNTDRLVADGAGPRQTADDIVRDPSELERIVEFAQQVAWTQGAVTAAGWLDWLVNLPLDIRLQLEDGTRLLAVHASPGTDSGIGINPTTTDSEIEELLGYCSADLVCLGHTHVQVDKRINGVHVVNPGSLSNPVPDDLRSGYALLSSNVSGYDVDFRRVEYDRAAVIDQLEQVRQASMDFISRRLRGEHFPPWVSGEDFPRWEKS